MKIITFSEHLYGLGLMSKALVYPATVLEAHRPYLFSKTQHESIIEGEKSFSKFMAQSSDAWPLLKQFHIEADGKGKQILLHNNVGGTGDNIMMWPLARILHQRGYKVNILLRPGYEFLWLGFPWIESLVVLPTPWNRIQQFDAHLFFEFLTNFYMHSDQGHPLDIMLSKAGIDPAGIPDSEKRLFPQPTAWETAISNRLYADKKIAFFQMSASQHSRSLPPDRMRNFLTALAKEFPDIHWIGIYGGKVPHSYYEPPLDEPNIEFRSFERMRTLWGLVKKAVVCVSPDTMLIHIAGAQGVPCVGLWGHHDPATRTRYYLNHFPIYLSEKCPKAPCYWPSAGMPTFCPDTIPDRSRCGVLQAITEDILIAKVREALASPRLVA